MDFEKFYTCYNSYLFVNGHDSNIKKWSNKITAKELYSNYLTVFDKYVSVTHFFEDCVNPENIDERNNDSF